MALHEATVIWRTVTSLGDLGTWLLHPPSMSSWLRPDWLDYMFLCIYVHLGSPSPVVDIREFRSHLAVGAPLGDNHRANWTLLGDLGTRLSYHPMSVWFRPSWYSYHVYLRIYIYIYIRLDSPSSIVTHTWFWDSPGDWLLIRRQSSSDLALH